MKTRKTEISDFTFKMTGYGHYKVTYKSPVERSNQLIKQEFPGAIFL